MELWDTDFLDMIGAASFAFDGKGSVEFLFGCRGYPGFQEDGLGGPLFCVQSSALQGRAFT